jgi:signal transduction histidine kinase
MRLRLRWKIMLFTVLPLVSLAFLTLWVVNRSISRQVHDSIERDLERASAVLDNMVIARERSLAVAAQVIVADPKFFSVLTIPGSSSDPQLRATVTGVAVDFNRITQTDLFEVLSVRGDRLASVGRDASSDAGRRALVSNALSGRPSTGILVEPGAHYQVSVTPVIVGRTVVGALLLGSRIGPALATQLKELTRSEVTFVSGTEITGTTLDNREGRRLLLQRFGARGPKQAGDSADGTVSELRAHGHTYLTLARPFSQTRPDEGQVFVMQRALDAETAFLRSMQGDLMQLGIAAVIVALLAGYLIAERITSPVRRLVRGAEEMERGNYDYPLDVRHRDEIGYLARRFEDMRSRHRAYVQSLQDVARVKGEFLSVASHELRTPISVIAGFRELMATNKLGQITDQQRQALEAIDRSVQTLTRITEDATRMAQIHGDTLELAPIECDVDELIESAVTEAAADAPGRQVKIECHVPPDLGAIRVDRERLIVAIANLVRNGIRFTPDGGRVTVQARRIATELEITISDTGVGIQPERQATLFDSSYADRSSLNHHSSSRLEFNSAGLGLGLSIARGIVRAHRGTLALRSQPGRGSVFVIRIPIDPAHHAIEPMEEAA